VQTATFSLQIDAKTTLLFYRGTKHRLQVTADDGRTINLPWKLLQPYVTSSGVQGRFAITFDEMGKCIGLQRVSGQCF